MEFILNSVIPFAKDDNELLNSNELVSVARSGSEPGCAFNFAPLHSFRRYLLNHIDLRYDCDAQTHVAT